jgi:hypothetical protein
VVAEAAGASRSVGCGQESGGGGGTVAVAAAAAATAGDTTDTLVALQVMAALDATEAAHLPRSTADARPAFPPTPDPACSPT